MQAIVDPITQKELQWSALKASVVGTYYDNDRSEIDFGNDVDTFFAPHAYAVYVPEANDLDVLLNSPLIRQFVESFERVSGGETSVFHSKTGTVDLDGGSPIRMVITVDGGQAVVPHPIRREKALAFIQVAACLLRMEDFHYMRNHPMMDPRDLSRMTEEKVWYNPSVIPLVLANAAASIARRPSGDILQAFVDQLISP